jgi:hypothetical protein
MCRVSPGWPTPAEAQTLIDNGHGASLMLDWWEGGGVDDGNIHVLCPATVGEESGRSIEVSWLDTSKGVCTFLKNERCAIHGQPGRPAECRAARHDARTTHLHAQIAEAWNTDEGRALASAWVKRFMS